jgi:valyl-tRNA synthetase
MSRELAKAYDPSSVEQRLYGEWESSGVFAPSGDGEPFCIVLPPPNITGALHLGHALDHSIQDAIIRRRRMQGYRALWLPGTDHAQIATQNVVERELAKQGISRHDLGREAFVEKVWEWKREYGARITKQMRRLGDSVDWSREAFTMDETLSAAVRLVFVRLFDEGLIYRGNRITNWCPRCMTALSDVEVEHADVDGELVQLRYPLTDGSGHITIATTRVETMLADTAVAVNPKDPRYTHLVGKTATLPLIGRTLTIVGDDAIDMEFGTGALKVTPAHDPVDFEIADRHGLEIVNGLNPDGTISEIGGPYAGMDRFEARKAVLGEEQRPYMHAVGHCSRCSTEVEPWLSEQWFVKMEPLARPAIAAVKDERVRFVPEKYARNYYDWMENIRDWCISRQLWWGHRIPVWTCADGHMFAANEDPTSCRDCASTDLTQDPDTLDTWFSSALWPFSTLGWPDDTDDLAEFYPNDVLVTGYDIITFWVSRMMVMALHFLDEPPFATVSIHGMVRDGRGRKMSKSVGNAMDPLDLIDKYGADALRLTLLRGATFGGDVALDEKWVEGDRNFCNKLWNIARFVFSHLDGEVGPLPPAERRTLADRWILSRLDHLTFEVDDAMEHFDVARAAQSLRQFVWTEFADWYVEWSKGRLYDGTPEEKADQTALLGFALERILTLLHPFTPFVTEELWRTLTGRETIMTNMWPASSGVFEDAEAEDAIGFLQTIVSALRRFRADHNLAPSLRPTATLHVPDDEDREIALAELDRVRALAGWGDLHVTADAPSGGGAQARLVLDDAIVSVPLEGLLDLDAERARLTKDRTNREAEIARINGKLEDPAFVQRAPEHVVATQRERLAAEVDAIERIDQALRDLG